MERCTQIFDGDSVRAITQADRDQIQKYVNETSATAMRNLSLAYKTLDEYNSTMKWSEVEDNLIFL